MKKYTLLLAAIIFASITHAQITFEKTYGGNNHDEGNSVQQTNDYGYIICGSTRNFDAGDSDVYLIKTDENGDTLWTKTYGGLDYDEGNSVQQTNDNGYIICGSSQSFDAKESDVYLIKTDNDGDTIWTRTYGGKDYYAAKSIQQTSDNGYIICGSTQGFGAVCRNIYLIKTDTNGDTLWTRTYGERIYGEGNSIQQTNDNGYIVCGSSQSFDAEDSDVYLIKTDENGDTLWTKTYGGEKHDKGYSIQLTNDNGYIICGSSQNFGVTYNDVYLIKTDKDGNTLWAKTYKGKDYGFAKSIQQTNDNGYIVCGYTQSFNTADGDLYLLKTDANGKTIWTKFYGGDHSVAGASAGASVKQTNDNGYIVCGSSQSLGSGPCDVYLIKTNANGYVGISEKAKTISSFDTYPNPCNDIININIKNKTDKIEIYNINGQLVYSKQYTNKDIDRIEQVDLSNHPKGIYFVKQESGNNVRVGKIVIQ